MTKFQRIIEGGAPYLAKVMAKMILNLEIEMSVLENFPMNERESKKNATKSLLIFIIKI